MITLIFVLLLIGVIISLLKYSKEGDIKILTSTEKNNLNKIENKEKIKDCIFNLVIYKNNYIRWNIYVVLYLFTAMLIVNILTQFNNMHEQNTSQIIYKIILVTAIIFIFLDIPQKWIDAHIHKGAEKKIIYLLQKL